MIFPTIILQVGSRNNNNNGMFFFFIIFFFWCSKRIPKVRREIMFNVNGLRVNAIFIVRKRFRSIIVEIVDDTHYL